MFLKLATVFISTLICVSTEELPSFITKCHFGDSDCICKSANEVIKVYPSELPQLGFAQFDPWRVKKLNFDQNIVQPGDLKLSITDSELRGFSGVTFNKVLGWGKNPASSKFEIHGTIPKLNFTGNYNVEGRVLVLPIQGNGVYNMHMDDVHIKIKFNAGTEYKGGKQFLKIKKLKLRIDPAKFHIELKNLFGGNEELGKSMNEVINQNWRYAWDEIAPALYEINEVILKENMDNFFTRYAYEDMFLPDE